MKVLLLGANGFIGRYLLARLLAAGHKVIPAVRRPTETDALIPTPCSIAIDLNRDTRPEDWLPRLAGIDAVINCAGILQHRTSNSITAVHYTGPRALFTACQRSGVRRVIQISAISADRGAGTAYASSKRDADDFLATVDLDWIVLRPSLVYAEGAYGGTAFFRALAALPFVVPMIGAGEYVFQPIHVDDLAEAILRILADPSISRRIIDPVGPDVVTLAQIVTDLRRWLGFRPATLIPIPLVCVQLVARLGDFVGGTINTTALRQLVFGNTGNFSAFADSVGFNPRRWHNALYARPSQTQDRWHARIYFLRPLLRWTLAGMWVASGLIGLLQPGSTTAPIAAGLGLSGIGASAGIWASCLLDFAIGIATALRWRPALTAAMQIATVIAYTISLTIAAPSLWLDPFGPLLKNLPILVAVLVLAAIEDDR